MLLSELNVIAATQGRVKISARRDGRRRLLSGGEATGRCGETPIRLRPTGSGRRLLRPGRRLVIGLRLLADGASLPATSRARVVRLHR